MLYVCLNSIVLIHICVYIKNIVMLYISINVCRCNYLSI